MIRKKKHMTAGKYYLLGLIAAVGIVSALWCQSIVSLADSIGTVSAESAIIRKETNTSSEALGSVARGTTVSITDEVQDSSGTLWYQVSVDGKTGYIRSDLMNKSDEGQTGTGAPGALAAPDTVLDAQYAVVSADTVNVRSKPSANESAVDKLNRNAQVIVGGETQGSDGKKWYYVTFTGTSGTEKSGFIRSDLLTLGDMVPVPEEIEPEPEVIEPEPETPVNNDYEVNYKPNVDGSGTFEWYLYDYTDKTSPEPKVYRVQDLMRVTQQRSESDAADAKTVVRQRIVIVVLIVLMVLLIAVMVIMALKLRDLYYEDYEDEEEQEETSAQLRRRSKEQEETSAQRRRRSENAEEASTQRRRRTTEQEEASTQRRRRSENAEEDPTQRRRRTEESEETSVRRRRRMEDTEGSTRRRQMRDERGNDVREVEYHEDDAGSAPVKTAQKRKTKNFLLDDDEFEFEFLNMDDKN